MSDNIEKSVDEIAEIPVEEKDLKEVEGEVVEKEEKDEDKSGKAECKPCQKKTTIGGQALIEGVMMVGPKRTCMAVRKGDGTIHVEEIKQGERVSYFETVPFVRGCLRFYKMLVTGTGAMPEYGGVTDTPWYVYINKNSGSTLFATKLVFEDGIITVGKNSFTRAYYVEEINAKDCTTLTTIGESAFKQNYLKNNIFIVLIVIEKLIQKMEIHIMKNFVN